MVAQDAREVDVGPVSAILSGPDLRSIRFGELEAVRRIYVAVRDDAWNTIPGTVSNLTLQGNSALFRVGFDGRHRYGTLDFAWRGTITGSAAGVITYEMDGIAETDFRYNRIGLNVHHPLTASVGRPFHARTPDGRIDGTLPQLIGPQKIDGGFIHALFPAFEALTIEMGQGLAIHFEFEGDLFEVEDHRNWSDANFKTYGPSLMKGFPLTARRGDRLRQRVVISIMGKPPKRTPGRPLRVELGEKQSQGLPALGLGMASHGGHLSAREVAMLRSLQLDHVRVELVLGSRSYEGELRRALEAATELHAALELAVFLGDDCDAPLANLRGLLQTATPAIARVLVHYGDGIETTPGELVRRVRETLAPVLGAAPVIGGTSRWFADLNRWRPAVEAMDGVVFSLTPQVHACEEIDLVENLEGQLEVVKSARAIALGKEIVVSPVTLVSRNGPYPAGPAQPGSLPAQVDVRQAGLFGAAWTAGSLKALAESGVTSSTYYETTGWLGVIETDAGSPMPSRFPSVPGGVFPIYHVFADLGEWKGARLLTCSSNDPLRVQALAVRHREATHVIVVNLTPHSQLVVLGRLAGSEASIRSMDEATVGLAMSDPTTFRSVMRTIALVNSEAVLELPAYAVIWLDAR